MVRINDPSSHYSSAELEQIVYSIHIQTTYGAGPEIHKSAPTYHLVAFFARVYSRCSTRAASSQPLHRNSGSGEKLRLHPPIMY